MTRTADQVFEELGRKLRDGTPAELGRIVIDMEREFERAGKPASALGRVRAEVLRLAGERLQVLGILAR